MEMNFIRFGYPSFAWDLLNENRFIFLVYTLHKGCIRDSSPLPTTSFSNLTYRLGLTECDLAKDALEPTKQNGVVYKIPCDCGKVYIGEQGDQSEKG